MNRMQRVSDKSYWLRTLLAGVLLTALAWPFFLSFQESLKRTHWFHLTEDEAMHTELIERLAQTGEYGQWNSRAFAPQLTTGPAVVVPGAIVSKITGVSSARSGRVVVLVYHIGLLLVVYLIIGQLILGREKFRETPWPRHASSFMVTAGIFHWAWRSLDETHYYIYGVLGEGPAAFYLLLSLLMFSNGRLRIAGAAASLAILCKPTFGLLSVLLVAVGLFRIVSDRKLGPFLQLLSGLAIPWILWVGWMAAELGLQGATQFWLDYPEIMRKTNGAGLPRTSFLENLGPHIMQMHVIVKKRGIALLLLSLILSIQMIRARSPLAIFSAFFLIHFGWWMMLSPGTQARYLFPAATVGWVICIAWILNWGYEAAKDKLSPHFNLNWRAVSFFVAGAFLLRFGPSIGNTWVENANNLASCGLCRQIHLQKFWKYAIDRPQYIWTTSRGYTQDTATVLSAPHWPRQLNHQNMDRVRSGDWVVHGDMPQSGLLERLMDKGCVPIHTVPGTDEGFWQC